jgi:hypothetical protein
MLSLFSNDFIPRFNRFINEIIMTHCDTYFLKKTTFLCPE